MDEKQFLYTTCICSVLGIVLLYFLLPSKLEGQENIAELEGEISYFVVKDKLTMVYVKPTKEIPVIVYGDVAENVGDKVLVRGKFDLFNKNLQFIANQITLFQESEKK